MISMGAKNVSERVKLVNAETKLSLLDLIDINLLQGFQDAFALALDVASITVDVTGPITAPSNFTDFCLKHTKKLENGLSRCNDCDIKWGEIAPEMSKPVICQCQAGLTVFSVPIVVEGIHIASILGGQVLTEEPNEEHFRETARQIGIDEDEYIVALKKIKVVTPEYVQHAADLLFIAANAISKSAHRNLQLMNKNKREALLRTITEAIRSSLDINETKQKIVDIICNTIDADRCFIIDYDKDSDKFLPIKHEYLSSIDIPEFKQIDVNTDIPNLANAVKEGKTLVIKNKEIFFNEENHCFEQEKKIIDKFSIHSSFTLPFYYADNLLGALAIHYINEGREISDSEIDLISIVADQISTAIYQAKLYESEKYVSQKEFALRKIADIFRSSLDAEEIKKSFVDIACDFFNADRCLFVDYDKQNEIYLPFRIEKLKSKNIQSLVGVDIEKVFPEFSAKLKNGRNIIIKDLHKTLSRNPLLGYKSLETLQKFGAKSDYGLLVKYRNQIIGILILHFTEKVRALSHDDFTFLKVLRDQAGVALHQAELYQNTKKTAERESLLREILETIRSSTDIDEIKKNIVNEVGRAMKADRCFIMEYDKREGKFLPVSEEYLSSDNIYPYSGTDINQDVPRFAEALKKGEKVLVYDKKNILNTDNEKLDSEIESIERSEVKSAFAFPFYYFGDLLGALAIHYVNEAHILDSDEIDFLNMVANQIAVAFYQAKLYKMTKEQAQRESLLRNITANIRASLDLDQTLSFICEETAKLFNVQRSGIIVFPDPENYEVFTTRKEYKASPEIKGFADAIGFEKAASYLGAKLIRTGEVLPIDNIHEISEPDYLKNIYESIGVKSIIGISIRKDKDAWGTLVLSEYNTYRHWSEEEQKLLKTIADQVYLAINQAELFEKEKKAAEREKSLREMVEIIRQSLDVNVVKQAIVNETAKFFNADRCFVVEFDESRDTFLPLDCFSEYRAFPELHSFIGYEFGGEEIKEFSDLHRKLKMIYIEDAEEFIKTHNLQGTGEEKFIRDSGSKSGIGQAIFYQQKLVGVLAIHFVKEKRILTSEDFDFINDIAIQAGGALYQSKLFETVKRQAEKETLLRQFIEAVRSSMSINFVKHEMVFQIGKLLKADRVAFADYDFEQSNYFISADNEYRSSSNVKTFVGVDFASIPGFVDAIMSVHLSGTDIIFSNLDKYLEEKQLYGTPVEKFYTDMGFISSMAINITHGEFFYGNLVVTYEEKRDISEDDFTFIKALANQAGIAIYQASLYQKTQIQAERERVSRNIIEALRSSIDINIIKNTIVNEIAKAIGADICFIMLYDPAEDVFCIDEYSEYLSSPNEKSFIGFDTRDPKVKFYMQNFKLKKEVFAPNVEEYLFQNNLYGTPEEEFLREHNVKSSYNLPIYYTDTLLGFVITFYTNDYKLLGLEDIEFLRTIATQSGIAIYQASLYQKTQIQAERERVSKNIVEILRSSLDKTTIKRLFVKNVGKYFNADRVFFADFDSKNKMYLPVDKYSEYLSSPDEQSFVGIDWSKNPYRENILPLLDKREVKIYSIDEYLKEKQINLGSKSLFEEADIKSCYGFPVLYQERIIGFFCIEFTQQVQKLSDEDINRIRNMCTQIGIALYHAELFVKANEAVQFKGEFILNISDELIVPLNSIINFSQMLSTFELSHYEQLQYLININKSAKLLLEMANDIVYISEIESEDFKLNRENFDSQKLICEVADSVKAVAGDKNINMKLDIMRVEIFADKVMLTQILYKLLINAIKFTLPDGEINLRSYFEEGQLIISIEDLRIGNDVEEQNRIFEKLRVIDSSYPRGQQGAGLGLSIVKKLINFHSGSIHVEAVAGKGARFWFSLPNASLKNL